MQLGLVIAIALLIIGVVAWPLVVSFRRRPADADGDTAGAGVNADADAGGDSAVAGAVAGDAARLSAELNDVYDTIRTLQTEHSLGHIADADYQAQLDEYRQRAARILRALDGAADSQPDSGGRGEIGD